MLTKKLLLIAASLLLGASFTAQAARGGGGPGGMSSGHISNQGLANTNGPNAADRDKGRERAADRMSAQGRRHDQSAQKHGKGKRHHAPSPPAPSGSSRLPSPPRPLAPPTPPAPPSPPGVPNPSSLPGAPR